MPLLVDHVKANNASASQGARTAHGRHRGDDPQARSCLLRQSSVRPIFEREIRDWDAHLGKLCAFWSSVALMTGRYKGKPVPAHVKLVGVGPAISKGG